MQIHTYICLYVFAFPTKTPISKKIASDHNPPARKRGCVLEVDFSSPSASFANVVPISLRAARKGCLFHLLPLMKVYSCLVAVGMTMGWLAPLGTQVGRCPASALSAWRCDTWVTTTHSIAKFTLHIWSCRAAVDPQP